MSEQDERETRRQEAARLYRSGLTERQVADRMGVTKTTIHGILNTAGVRRRRRGPKRSRTRRRSKS